MGRVLNFNFQDPLTEKFINGHPSINSPIIFSEYNPFFQHALTQFFIYQDNEGKILGRVFASIDQKLEQKLISSQNTQEEIIGHFGFLECIEDYEVFSQLMNACENWLKSQGATQLQGPMQFSIFHSYRFMTEGFDTTPFLGEVRNPPYYIDYIKKYGLSEGPAWKTWDFNREELLKCVEYCQKKIDEIHQRLPPSQQNFSCHFLSKESLYSHDYSQKIFQMIMENFKYNFGFTHIDYHEFMFNFQGLKDCLSDEDFTYYLLSENNLNMNLNMDLNKSPYNLSNQLDKFKGLKGMEYGYHDLLFPHPRYIFHTFAVDFSLRKSSLAYFIIKKSFEEKLNQNIYNHFLAVYCKEGQTIFQHIKPYSRRYNIFIKNI